MELTMSMFATQADYRKARSGLHEGTVAEVAMELGCEADNEVLLAEIAAMKKDAERYRILRRGQNWSVIDGIGDTLRADSLDAAIDATTKTPNAGGNATERSEGRVDHNVGRLRSTGKKDEK